MQAIRQKFDYLNERSVERQVTGWIHPDQGIRRNL